MVFCALAYNAPVRGQCTYKWRPGYTPVELNGPLYAVRAWDPDGPGPAPPVLAVGGIFSLVGNVSANAVATWDGASWQSLGTGMNSSVLALTEYQGDLVAGGEFTTAGNETVNHIARWNGVSWQPFSTGMNGPVYDLTVHDGDLIAAGAFSMAGRAAANRIARWNGFEWQPLGAGQDNTVYSLASNGVTLVAGGSFSNADNEPASRIAFWNGSTWQPMGSGINGDVLSLLFHDGTLIAGGAFTTAGGTIVNRIANWDGKNWQPLGTGMTGPGFPPTNVDGLTAFDGKLFAGGNFLTAGGTSAQFVAAWDGMSWSSLGTGLNAFAYALSTFGGELIVGGSFLTAGGSPSAYWARWGPDCPRGDLNCDQQVNFDDVAPFVTALLNAPALSNCEAYTANVNGDLLSDGAPAIDGRDVEALVACILTESCP